MDVYNPSVVDISLVSYLGLTSDFTKTSSGDSEEFSEIYYK